MRSILLLFLVILLVSPTMSYSQSTEDNMNAKQSDSTQNVIGPDDHPLIFFDDRRIESTEELQSIDPQNVQEIVVVKDSLSEYIDKYGPEAKGGVIFVYSKKFVARRWYLKFAEYNRKVAKLIGAVDFQYPDYKVYLNNELLKPDFFDGLEKKMGKLTIDKVKFRKSKDDNTEGKVLVKLKPVS